MSATREPCRLPTVPEFLACLFTPATDRPVTYIGPCDRLDPEPPEAA